MVSTRISFPQAIISLCPEGCRVKWGMSSHFLNSETEFQRLGWLWGTQACGSPGLWLGDGEVGV